jgi:hypothetical protein
MTLRSRRAPLALLLRCFLFTWAIACAFPARPAHAASPADLLPRLPSPFVLSDLSHAKVDTRIDWFLGRISPEAPDRSAAFAGMLRPSIEMSLLRKRRLYLGVTYPLAVALPPDGGLATGEVGARATGTRTLFGNVETHIRSVFSLPSALEIGFSLGVAAPTATFERTVRANRSAADAAATLDPTNYVHFLPERVGLRLAGDLRIVRGPLVLQGRHGLDILIDNEGIESASIAGRLLGHVGLLLRPDIEASIEASQIYFFSAVEKTDSAAAAEASAAGGQVAGKVADAVFAETYRISDNRRSALTLGPAIRFALPEFDIGAAVVTNLGDPLSPVASGFVALRVSLITHAGVTP